MTVRRTPGSLYRPRELVGIWSLPAPDFAAVPTVRAAVPLAPAPPGVTRASPGAGVLRDEHGPVTIDEPLRRQHVAVVGAVEQGKTSFLVASAREDLRRDDCALIVLDPKGDAAESVLSVVPRSRTCTLLDMAAPTAGFNPLAVDAAPDAIADHVVAALRGLFSEGEVRGSSDRYLRNALIAVLACGERATLWDVARLLEVGDAGRALRERVADRLAAMPAYAELAGFLGEELPAQLADARATTTAKLDAPANKLARVLNSPAIKRVLLNDSLRIDLDRVIEGREVLIVRGALGEIGAGNVGVLMQLLLGMLDAALGRLQDRRAAGERGVVALKVDEAPLVINTAFAQTLALKRSAGLETVACWQTDAQWEPELRSRLDALFAHRVLFATASSEDARAASALLMAEYSDQLRAGDHQLARLASPDVRLHLPRHAALASWTTGERAGAAVHRGDDAAAGRSRAGRLAHACPACARWPRAAGPAAAPGCSRPEPIRRAAAVAPPGYAVAGDCARASPRPRATPSCSRSTPRGACAGWRQRARARDPALDASDRPLLVWVAGARCALTSQAHRRVNPARSLTVTQRALKRLADAGLVGRFQFHRDDGGGVPLCCSPTDAALALLGVNDRHAPRLADEELDRLRTDVHVVGWLLALEDRCGDAIAEVLGPGRALIAPPAGAALELPDGLRGRDFLATRRDGSRGPVSRFAAVRPHAVIEMRSDGVPLDVLLVWDPPDPVVMLEACDHLLSGWWRTVARYRRLGAPPRVVVVCADEEAAFVRAVLADSVLSACLARPGLAAQQWERPGRCGIVFAAEADVHRGSLAAWAVPALPPPLRGADGVKPSRVEVVRAPPAPEARAAKPPWR